MSRPSSFTQAVADEICSQLAEGKSMRTVCLAEDMPDKATVFRWLRTMPTFCDQYTRAKEESADALVEEMLDISDDASNDWMERNAGDNAGWLANGDHIQRSRLRVETRKWIAAKLKAKRYGEKVEHTGSVAHTYDSLLLDLINGRTATAGDAASPEPITH